MLSRKLTVLATTALLVANAACDWLEPPPTTAPPDTVQDCSWWAVAEARDTCQSLADGAFISVQELKRLNPSLAGTSCPITSGYSYCVEQNYGKPPTATPSGPITPTTTAQPSTAPGNSITTPKPIQTGMATNCNKFIFVKEGDGFCYDLAQKNGISLDSFYAWNAALGGDCSGLWLNTWYCVGLVGQTTPPVTTTTTAKPTTTTTKPGNGISTPSPTQPGMTPNCNKFYKSIPDVYCAEIAETNGISLQSFISWNAGVGANCEVLWQNTWYCVNIIGGTTSSKPTTTAKPTTTTTTTGSGIATPTPIQPNMTKSCKGFHFVVKGDICETIAATYKISLASFYRWNPDVGNTCATLFGGYYVCVRL